MIILSNLSTKLRVPRGELSTDVDLMERIQRTQFNKPFGRLICSMGDTLEMSQKSPSLNTQYLENAYSYPKRCVISSTSIGKNNKYASETLDGWTVMEGV